MMLLVLSLNVYAQRQRPNEQRRPQMEEARRVNGPERIPNLTEEQKTQLKAFRIALEKETLPLKNEVQELEAKLKTLMSQDEVKTQEAGRVIDEISDLKSSMMKKKIKHTAQIKSILDDEQKVFFNKHLTERKNRRPMRGK